MQLFTTDQLNSTVHGTMKVSPYELVFGQPPCQNIFPGAHGNEIMEEDLEDVLEEDNKDSREGYDLDPLNKVNHGHSSDSDNFPDDASRIPQPDVNCSPLPGDDFDSNPALDTELTEEDIQHTPKKTLSDCYVEVSSHHHEHMDIASSNNVSSYHDQVEIVSSDEASSHHDQDMEIVPLDVKSTNIDSIHKPNLNLGFSKKHLKVRKKADELYQQNAERIKIKYFKAKNKKVMLFKVGDFVSVRVPRIDRASTDIHRLPCIVVQKIGSKFHLYRLR